MKTLTLVSKNIQSVGTFGHIYDGDQKVCCTVEREWLNNQPNISCIPAGTYQVERHQSPKHGDTWILSNENVGVSEFDQSMRYACLIHSANFPGQLQGCIAPGLKYHPHKWGVSSSRNAMEVLRGIAGDSFTLEIVRH